jgi:uncharacterized membrane protein
MDATVSEWMNLLFRWVHVVAGITWIGHLYFFNFVNAQLAAKYDADSKKKVVPELMPRALYWFRWGAMYTLISGYLLLGIVIYMGGVLVNDPSEGQGLAMGVGGALLTFGYFVYEGLWKTPIAKNPIVAAVVAWVLLAATAFGLQQVMSGRAMWIHIGALLGTNMAMNVWMRIWPAQRKIIAGIAGTAAAPDASVAAMAGLRSKHNTYMSVPLVLTMVSNHFPTLYGSDAGWLVLSVMIALSFGATKFMYQKSASAAPASY